MLNFDIVRLCLVYSFRVVGVGLMFMICGGMLVVVLLIICVKGVRLYFFIVFLEVSSNVVLLLLIFDVFLVVMLLLLWNGVCCVDKVFRVVLVLGCLFLLMIMGLFLCCGIVIGMIFFVSWLVFCVVMVCC